jgi:hypothetical protein
MIIFATVLHKMKLKKGISFLAILQLIIYLQATLLPKFHNHEAQKFSAAISSSCQKTITSNGQIDACGHDNHITEEGEKCIICDQNITLLSEEISKPVFVFIPIWHKNNTTNISIKYPTNSRFYCNKGPPFA